MVRTRPLSVQCLLPVSTREKLISIALILITTVAVRSTSCVELRVTYRVCHPGALAPHGMALILVTGTRGLVAVTLGRDEQKNVAGN